MNAAHVHPFDERIGQLGERQMWTAHSALPEPRQIECARGDAIAERAHRGLEIVGRHPEPVHEDDVRRCRSLDSLRSLGMTSAVVHVPAYAHSGDGVPDRVDHVVAGVARCDQKRFGRSGVNVTGPMRPDGSGVHCAAVNRPSGPRFAASRGGKLVL